MQPEERPSALKQPNTYKHPDLIDNAEEKLIYKERDLARSLSIAVHKMQRSQKEILERALGASNS